MNDLAEESPPAAESTTSVAGSGVTERTQDDTSSAFVFIY